MRRRLRQPIPVRVIRYRLDDHQYMAELADPRRLVVRNGHHREQTVTTAAGPVEVRAPRVNDRRVEGATGQRQRFSSQIPASWCRKSPEISEVLPLPHLHGLSSGDFVLAPRFQRGAVVGHGDQVDQAVARGSRCVPGA